MALTAAELKDALSYAFAGRSVSAGDQLALATRLLPVAAALVTRYAPTAPAEIREEAEIRIAMFYAESRGGSASTDEVKPLNLSAAFRLSGAAGILSPWHIRRALPIGEAV